MPFYTAYGTYAVYTTTATDHYTTAYSANYGTITNYVTTQYVRVMKSAAGVITELANQALSTIYTIASFRVKTSGTTLTIQAYTDTNLTTQLGSDITYTVAGATTTGKYGISLKPSFTNQSYAIASSVNITRN